MNNLHNHGLTVARGIPVAQAPRDLWARQTEIDIDGAVLQSTDLVAGRAIARLAHLWSPSGDDHGTDIHLVYSVPDSYGRLTTQDMSIELDDLDDLIGALQRARDTLSQAERKTIRRPAGVDERLAALDG